MSDDPKNALVWAEIRVTDLQLASKFYGAVTGRNIVHNEIGPQPIAVIDYEEPGISAHLTEGPPAAANTGTIVHLAAAGTIEDMIDRVNSAGGTVQGDPVAMPFGRFVYVADLDGNTIGLFEGK